MRLGSFTSEMTNCAARRLFFFFSAAGGWFALGFVVDVDRLFAVDWIFGHCIVMCVWDFSSIAAIRIYRVFRHSW